MRQFGQTTLPASFISGPSVVNEVQRTKPSKQRISLSEFLNRKLGKTGGGLLQEKRVSIGSLGCPKIDFSNEQSEAGSSSIPKGTIFQQFSRVLKEKRGVDLGDGGQMKKMGVDCSDIEMRCSRKRKNPANFYSGDGGHNHKHVLILGDDPKPKHMRRDQKKLPDRRPKTIYNHYASGQGWWDGDKEGIDSEEVGHIEVWEGLGSTTLGGLEWH